MKHFEQVWERAEKVSEKILNEIPEDELENKIHSRLKDLLNINESKEKNMGEILFLLSYFSYKFNVNVFDALMRAATDAHVDFIDPEP